jgi:hypothetical protein
MFALCDIIIIISTLAVFVADSRASDKNRVDKDKRVVVRARQDSIASDTRMDNRRSVLAGDSMDWVHLVHLVHLLKRGTVYKASRYRLHYL